MYRIHLYFSLIEKWDEINMEMIEYLAKNNLYDLVERSFNVINDQNTYRAQIILCKLE